MRNYQTRLFGAALALLFACGIATLIQTIGFGPFGIRLPIIMGKF